MIISLVTRCHPVGQAGIHDFLVESRFGSPPNQEAWAKVGKKPIVLSIADGRNIEQLSVQSM